MGAPDRLRLDALASWTTHATSGVKYFSGTATYIKDMQAPPAWFRPGARVVLDLGKVKEIAEVTVNGKAVGLAWRAPFRVDVTDALKPGANHLEVKVTNLWANRMIGDVQPGVEKPYTFSLFKPYTKDSPLLESGLLGPVSVATVTRQ